MNWLAILLSLASLGGSASPADVKPGKQKCAAAKQQAAKQQATKRTAAKRCKAKPKKTKPKTAPRQQPAATRPADPDAPRRDGGDAPRGSQPDPEATPTPTATPKPNATPTPTATPAPTPAPPGTYPTRTNVDLDEWFVRPSYRILAAGSIDFNVNNRGEDDHNLAVRAGDREYAELDVAPGDTATLTVDLGLGTYTLYCSLPDHEEAGMRATISVR